MPVLQECSATTTNSERTSLYYRSAPRQQRRGNVPVQPQECPTKHYNKWLSRERACITGVPRAKQSKSGITGILYYYELRENVPVQWECSAKPTSTSKGTCLYYRSAPQNHQRRGNVPESQECPALQQPTEITYRNPRSGSQFTVHVNSHERSERPLHPIHLVGRSGGKPHDKLGQGAGDDDFIPATSTAQATTINHTATPTIL
jgi:hypothetical protein